MTASIASPAQPQGPGSQQWPPPGQQQGIGGMGSPQAGMGVQAGYPQPGPGMQPGAQMGYMPGQNVFRLLAICIAYQKCLLQCLLPITMPIDVSQAAAFVTTMLQAHQSTLAQDMLQALQSLQSATCMYQLLTG